MSEPLAHVMPGVLGLRRHLQIVGVIVALVAVLVMNDLAFAKWPTKHLFSDDSMLMALPQLSIRFALARIA